MEIKVTLATKRLFCLVHRCQLFKLSAVQKIVNEYSIFGFKLQIANFVIISSGDDARRTFCKKSFASGVTLVLLDN